MGRTSDEEGETSAKTCKSDDTNERPLKKARYVWQIKGKYHLKKPENAEGAKLYIADETKTGYTLHPVEVAHHETLTQEQDGHTLDIANSEVPKPDFARVLSPVTSEIRSPMESKELNPKQLQNWQARQVARCFVDNTINRVLEDMGFIPLPVDADDLMENFTMSGFRRNDEHLEDAAVRMAIHSHGLQRAVADMRGVNQNLNTCGVVDTAIYDFSVDPIGLQNGFSDDPTELMNRWYVQEFCNQSPPRYEQSPDVKHVYNDELIHGGCSVASQPSVSLKCASNEQFNNSGYMNKTSASCDSLGKELGSEHADVETAGNSEQSLFASDMNLDNEAEENIHTDFLDKAVAVAIQKKGLSTLSGVDYG